MIQILFGMRTGLWISGRRLVSMGVRCCTAGHYRALSQVANSQTARHVFDGRTVPNRTPRKPKNWLKLAGVSRNNLRSLDADFPIGLFTTVTGISGSGK